MTEAIKQGKVKVNGKTVESFNHPVNPAKDRVFFNGRPVAFERDEVICLMLNKPVGIVSTTSDEMGRRTVLSILPPKYRHYRLYPVGRLDMDTSGLLLLTNDGDLTYRLTHPRFEYEKEYLVQVKGRLNAAEKQKLEHGILLEDGLTRPAKVKGITITPFNYSIVIHEGKKRQVRRMFERLRHPVLSLKRIRVGSLKLGDLPEGSVRPLKVKEIQVLRGD